MSKIKFLARQGLIPIMKVTDIQQHLCDKGGGHVSIRQESTSPCEVQGGEKEKMDLKCKVALVTGGASGIGYAIANELLREGLYRVVIGDLEPCKGLQSAHKLSKLHGENKCCYMPLNVCCNQQLQDIMNKIKASFGNLDILVNNAGIISDDIDLELDTNLRSVIQGTMIAIDTMKQQKNKGGLVINIGDTKGLSGCKFFPVYASAKGGVHQFSMGIGQDSEKSNVRIIALAPGLTESDMGEKFKNKPDPPCMQQRASAVAMAVIYTAKYADSGSLWVVEEKKIYYANWPHKSLYLELKMCL